MVKQSLKLLITDVREQQNEIFNWKKSFKIKQMLKLHKTDNATRTKNDFVTAVKTDSGKNNYVINMMTAVNCQK